MASIGIKKRQTFSKYGKALDNFFMIFQPDNTKLQATEPSPEVLQDIEQRALQYNLKLQKAKETQGTFAFRCIPREKGNSYFIKHEGANRSYNPKYEFIKQKPVTYTIPKSTKNAKNTENMDENSEFEEKNRPFTAKARYFHNKPAKDESNEEIIEEKNEENLDFQENEQNFAEKPQINQENPQNVADPTENKQKIRAFSAKTTVSAGNPYERKVFGCIDFNKQTQRKPMNFVSSCQNEHNFTNFSLNKYQGKKVLNFKHYQNRKTYLCDDAKFELPDKFYLNNFNWDKIYPQKSKCFVNFDRFQEKYNKNLEQKNYTNSYVDIRNLPDMYEKLAHFKRVPSPNFNKLLGRNQAKILKERVANTSGFRPKSAYGKYANLTAVQLQGK